MQRGRVTDVEGGLFAVEFENGLIADFSRALLPDVAAGDIVDVSATAVERVDLGVWTQEELDRARAEARRLSAGLERFVA